MKHTQTASFSTTNYRVAGRKEIEEERRERSFYL